MAKDIEKWNGEHKTLGKLMSANPAAEEATTSRRGQPETTNRTLCRPCFSEDDMPLDVLRTVDPEKKSLDQFESEIVWLGLEFEINIVCLLLREMLQADGVLRAQLERFPAHRAEF